MGDINVHNNSDLAKFLRLYEGFGIKKSDFIITTNKDGKFQVRMEMSEEISGKFIGYPEFYSIVTFDSKGKFINQGFWE